MSVFTAGGFLSATISLIFLMPPFDQRRLLRAAGMVLAGIGLLIGTIIALGYATGTPMFYVNGEKFDTPRSYEDFKTAIGEVISKAQ